MRPQQLQVLKYVILPITGPLTIALFCVFCFAVYLGMMAYFAIVYILPFYAGYTVFRLLGEGFGGCVFGFIVIVLCFTLYICISENKPLNTFFENICSIVGGVLEKCIYGYMKLLPNFDGNSDSEKDYESDLDEIKRKLEEYVKGIRKRRRSGNAIVRPAPNKQTVAKINNEPKSQRESVGSTINQHGSQPTVYKSKSLPAPPDRMEVKAHAPVR
jgi:hypothetical protein